MQEMIAAPALGAVHPFLSAAGPTAAQALLAAARPFAAPRRDVIFAPEREAEALYLLLEGSVGLSMQGAGESRGLLEIIGPDDCFLMPAVILGGAWPFGAEALAPSRLLRIPAEAFHGIMVEEPRLAEASLTQMARQWRGLADQLTELKMTKASERVAHFLTERLLPSGRVAMPEPRAAIAARLGMTPESLSRAMHGLEAAGLVRLQGRRVEVPDAKALSGAARASGP
ncbi:MAG: Crp/Fnr family transcriptional regulator [Roseomonas sp.]|nr:Crp/Fnr family transcriptional regulator [Roseomonas sp.]MCA3329763.1 Crp/Fnr family transcriptional regulator [Roseomonas sp.]MCA3334380.1 Crp/Fnr family transcriptional regulator [Roseomonas sp.]MCA3380338.1 Crp/Fnr family transcriptional regulator [Roseomonas sp.]MCA3386444.1 Crp/Fnr family transcriptional regulator [Roseomonas sp.]